MEYHIADARLIGENGDPVKYVESPNQSSGLVPQGIVLHDTAGRLAPKHGTLDWFAQQRARASAHFTIERDGTAGQSVRTDLKAWHAGRSVYKGRPNCNSFTHGIEIVNPGRMERVAEYTGRAWFGEIYESRRDGYDVRFAETREHGAGMWMAYTAEQIEAVIEVCRALVDTYGSTFITTHWFISPGRKVDTNPRFPLEHVRAAVFGRRDPAMPQHADFVFGDAVAAVDAVMRAWPSRKSRRIGVAERGSRLDIVRSGHWNDPQFGLEPWHLCRFETGVEGWVHATLIDMDD